MGWRRASIAGVGATRQGKLPDETPLSLAAQAFRLALEDSGIDKNEVDGLLHHARAPPRRRDRRAISMSACFSSASTRASPAVLTMGGATGGALIQIAAMAIATGMAKTVACIFADTARTGGSRFAAAARRRRRFRRRVLGRRHVRQCRQQCHGLPPPHGALRLALGASRLDRRHLPQACVDEFRRDHARSDHHETTRIRRLSPIRCDCSTAA